jgi:hypothetical protein
MVLELRSPIFLVVWTAYEWAVIDIFLADFVDSH